jgi:hypothetical protein
MVTNIETLPTPDDIKKEPHWRVNIRPVVYNNTHFKGPPDAINAVKNAKVQFRGWSYPYVNEKVKEVRTDQYVASGIMWESYGYLEYWRLYYSGQFINLFGIRERLSEDWHNKLLKEAKQNILAFRADKNVTPVGFIDVTNMLYNFTEIFEFASRLYKEDVEICIELHNIKGFCLMAEFPRVWWGHYVATNDIIRISPEAISKKNLLEKSADIAIESIVQCFGYFGWDNPPVEILKSDQAKFLQGKF